MCSKTSLALSLDFSDNSLSGIDPNTLTCVISVILYTGNYKTSDSQDLSPITIQLKSGSKIFNTIVDLSDACGYGSKWGYIGISNITLSNNIPGGPISAPAAYVGFTAAQSKKSGKFILLFGNDKLTSDMLKTGYTASCSSSSYKDGNDCVYLVKVGGNMLLSIKPKIIKTPATTPGGIINMNTFVYDVTKYSSSGLDPISNWSTGEIFLVVFVILFIIICIIAIIVYFVSRPSEEDVLSEGDVSPDGYVEGYPSRGYSSPGRRVTFNLPE